MNNKDRIAFLGAISIFLASIEFLIPKPIPFFRLGLANLPFLLALPLFNWKELGILTLLKVLGQGIVNGTLGSYVFLFSLSGSLASAFGMFFMYKLFQKHISITAISFIGSITSNIVQLGFSVLFIFGTKSTIFATPLLAIGGITGILLGILATLVYNKSRWYKVFSNA